MVKEFEKMLKYMLEKAKKNHIKILLKTRKFIQ